MLNEFLTKIKKPIPLGGLINMNRNCGIEIQSLHPSYLPTIYLVLYSHSETIRDQSTCRSPRKWQLNLKLIAAIRHPKSVTHKTIKWRMGISWREAKGMNWDCSVLPNRPISRIYLNSSSFKNSVAEQEQRSRLLGNEKWRQKTKAIRSILNLGET